MKKLVLLLLIVSASARTLGQAGTYWQQQLSYAINVSLNDVEHTLDGFVKIHYRNNSPDTLHFIWFHIWPNAFRNDQTAYSEQQLQNGNTDFYFSDRQDRGYINRLDFRVNEIEAKVIDHPLYIDVCKVVLPQPLAPGTAIDITTPFHVKLPRNFSGFGHIGQAYQLTSWYPQPAVYDGKGWHEMPYLAQGDGYTDPGKYKVNITLPANYVVAAGGTLETELLNEVSPGSLPITKKVTAALAPKKAAVKRGDGNWKRKPMAETLGLPSAVQTKTLSYISDHSTGFSWYADKTSKLISKIITNDEGKTFALNYYYDPATETSPDKIIAQLKVAVVLFSSKLIDYPFPVLNLVSVDAAALQHPASPGQLFIRKAIKDDERPDAIAHAVALEWSSCIINPDLRISPWLSHGVAKYYEKRFAQDIRSSGLDKKSWLTNRLADDQDKVNVATVAAEKIDQPINTSSTDLSVINYNVIASGKTSLWLKQLEMHQGTTAFDASMHKYFADWQYRHPTQTDFLNAVNFNASGDQAYVLSKKGVLDSAVRHHIIKPAFLFSQKNSDQISYINFAPAAGYNEYDKFMIGAAIHNINLPPDHFQFYVVPLYATGSKQWNGLGDISYSWYPDTRFQKIELSMSAERFSSLSGTDSANHGVYGGFYKLFPSLRFTFRNSDPRSTIERWLELKTYFIGEKAFDYVKPVGDSVYHPVPQSYSSRYLDQATFQINDYRVLYPYDLQVQVQQASNFYRVNFTSHYFFNYAKGGGMSIRLFAAKFGYIGATSTAEQFQLSAYQPKLTATRGDEDYTYSNYFIGRNEATGFASQQIMIKDGGLKLRTDLFQDLQGRSDNWVAAANFNTTLPGQVIPSWLPLRIFADVGTYAGGWSSNSGTSRFLYVAGLQLSLFKNIVNIYAPLLYSSEFRSALKSVPEENSFGKKISFSIDIQNINFRKIFRNTPF